MTPERWKQVEALYHAAEALPVPERPAFLLRESSDDELRREVASLLENGQAEEGILGRTATWMETQLAATLSRPPLTGRTIGAYRIQALLGAGGMGEVYRARDTTLDRDVAVKILPAAFTADPDRLARFAREARVLASVNHPGICGIYGIDDAEGIRLLVLELVDGATLAERLAARAESGAGGLPIDEALAIGRQIAEALEFAHDKGIVHRDLKPANIKVTPDGVVKVLDFGLAKAVGGDASGPDLTLMPVSSMVGLRPGMVMGTAAYMSPEQARGLPVDRRTDIWAFGCVLYEMLTGRVAFGGATISDSIARVLEREPDWSILPPSLPLSVRGLLLRMLVKDPRQRLRDIGEVRIAVDAIGTESGAMPEGPTAPVVVRRSWLPWAAVAAIAIGGSAALAWRLGPEPVLAPVRFSHVLPPGQTLNGSRGAHIVALSPDGSQLVYSGAPHGLYLRPMSDFQATLIPGTDGFEVTEPVFKPDGRSIAFFTIGDRALERINVGGGAPQMLCPVDVVPTGVRWEAGGIIFGQGSKGIWRVPETGGTPEQLVRVKERETAYNPQTLPDGDHVLFTLAVGQAPSRWDRAQIVTESLSTRSRTLIVDGGSDARYLPSGYLLYALAGAVYAAGFDPARPAVTGERVPVVEGVRRASGGFTGAAIFTISETGTLAYVPGPAAGERSAPLDIGLMDRTGEIHPLSLPGGPYARPRASPDGRRIAFESDDGREAIVYTYELSGANRMLPLTNGGNNRFPVWVSNDAIAFQSDRDGDEAVWWQALDGTAARLTTPEPGISHAPESAHGDTLLYSARKGSDVSLWAYSLRTHRATKFDIVPSSATLGAAFAPDGRSVAYSTTQGNQMTLYVQGFPRGPAHRFTAKPSDTPKHARWSPDGKELCYAPNVSRFECVRITSEPFAFGNAVSLPKKLQGAPPGERTDYDITPAGQFLGLITAGHKEFVRGSDTEIDVVLHWFTELNARVPRR